jgi:hypothetical protein
MAAPRIWANTRQHGFRYRRQDFFAENGLIHVIDKDTGHYSCVSVGEFLRRARAFNKAAWRGRHDKRWTDERDELSRMVQDMIVCCEQAKRQGDPFDPTVMRQMADLRKNNHVSFAAVPPAPRRRVIVTGR